MRPQTVHSIETHQEGIVMKRFHVHVHVADLDSSVRFYSTLFGEEPAVIKERVRLIQGDLVVESRPRSGSRLTITFPGKAET